MCTTIRDDGVLPGWVCCDCNAYNGPPRATCQICDHPPCGTIDRASLARETNRQLGYVALLICCDGSIVAAKPWERKVLSK
jgi:hypothetical protein